MEMSYMVGTMVEVPRAALTADEIAEEAEFFSFGTNDMTQMTLGFSRDDTADLVNLYVDKGLLEEDPFKTIDIDGVGKIVEMAVKLGGFDLVRNMTLTCYNGIPGDGCMECPACKLRHKGLMKYLERR